MQKFKISRFSKRKKYFQKSAKIKSSKLNGIAWSRSIRNYFYHCFLLMSTSAPVVGSGGGCLGGFRVLPVFLVLAQPLCTGFEVRGRGFGYFLGLTGVFGLGPTTVHQGWVCTVQIENLK